MTNIFKILGFKMSNYIIHYGIEGQKWGHRNGPPYPLDYKQMSSAEKYRDKAKARLSKKYSTARNEKAISKLKEKEAYTYDSYKKQQLKQQIDNLSKAVEMSKRLSKLELSAINKMNAYDLRGEQAERKKAALVEGVKSAGIAAAENFVLASIGIPIRMIPIPAINTAMNKAETNYRISDAEIEKIYKEVYKVK